jgi:ketosteroid isomerase-like protein
MGADENAAIMRRAYDAFNSGDMDTLIELFDESAVWHTPGGAGRATSTRAAGRPWPTSVG